MKLPSFGSLSLIVLSLVGGNVNADVSGLNAGAMDELKDAGVDKYLGKSIQKPIQDTHDFKG